MCECMCVVCVRISVYVCASIIQRRAHINRDRDEDMEPVDNMLDHLLNGWELASCRVIQTPCVCVCVCVCVGV